MNELLSNDFKELDKDEKELLLTIQKGIKQAAITFYEGYKTGELDESLALEKKEDLFEVDLSSLDDRTLYTLYQYTDWNAPSYYLRKRHFGNWDKLDDETLMILVQMSSAKAKDELFNRYRNRLEEANDEILVLLAQEENQYALEILFERYLPFVKRIIRRLEKKFFFRGFETNDLVQEGVIGLFKSKDDYKIERKTKFKDFSRHVIEKHIGTLILRSSNYKHRVLNESFSYHSPIGNDSEVTFEQLLKSDANLPEEKTVNKETFYAIWDRLTQLEQDVLNLYSLGLSYEEIGEIVGKKKKAIDNTIQRIRKKGKSYEKGFHEDGDGIKASESEIVKWIMWLFKETKDVTVEMVKKYRKENPRAFKKSGQEKELAEIIYNLYSVKNR